MAEAAIPATRKAAIVGGNRIPFARSNSAYAQASNQDMLTATLDGLVAVQRMERRHREHLEWPRQNLSGFCDESLRCGIWAEEDVGRALLGEQVREHGRRRAWGER